MGARKNSSTLIDNVHEDVKHTLELPGISVTFIGHYGTNTKLVIDIPWRSTLVIFRCKRANVNNNML